VLKLGAEEQEYACAVLIETTQKYLWKYNFFCFYPGWCMIFVCMVGCMASCCMRRRATIEYVKSDGVDMEKHFVDLW